MIHVSYVWHRNDHHIRVRGTDPVDGSRVSTYEKIGDDVFAAAGIRRTSARAEAVARQYAAEEQRRLNAPELIGQRTARTIRTTSDKLDLADIWRMYQARNPNQIAATSMYRSAKQANALLRCRCDAEKKQRCLAHTPAEQIDLGAAEVYRDRRLQECAVCGESEHGTVKGRHAFRGVSPRSAYGELVLLRLLLIFARDRERETRIGKTSLHRLPSIKGRRGVRERITPTEEEFFRVYDACAQLGDDADRYRRMFGFAFATGLRRTPLLHFRREWYDAERQRITVPAEFMKGRGEAYRALDVPICRWAASFIDDLPPGLAWPNPDTGAPQVDLFRIETKLSKLANLPRKFSVHRLRAGFNSTLMNHRCRKHTRPVDFHVRELLLGHIIDPQVMTYSDFSIVLSEALAVVDCGFDRHAQATGANVLAFGAKRKRRR